MKSTKKHKERFYCRYIETALQTQLYHILHKLEAKFIISNL